MADTIDLTSLDPKSVKVVSTPSAVDLTKLDPSSIKVVSVPGIGSGLLDAIRGFNAGMAEHMPFSGLLDKGEAAARAAGQKTSDLLFGPPKAGAGTFSDYYKQQLGNIENERNQDVSKNKWSSIGATAGSFGGDIGTVAAVPNPGAKMSGIAGLVTRAATNVGAAALDAGTKDKSQFFDPDKAKQYATTASIAQGIVEVAPGIFKAIAEPISEVVSPAIKGSGEALQEYGASKAVKAAFGNAIKPYRALGKSGDFQENVVNEGEALLNNGVVSFGDKAENIRDKAFDALSKTWDKMNNIHATADAQGIAVSGEDVATKILDQASKIKDVPQNQGLIEGLQNQALYYEQRGSIPLSEAQALKNEYIWKMPTGNAAKDVLGSAGNNAVKSAIGDAMKETIQESPLSDEMKKEYPTLLQKYGAFAKAAGPASETALRELKNQAIGLGDKIAGGIGAVLGEGEKPIERSLQSALFAFGNKLVRERGNSAMGVVADKLGQAIENSPDFAAKYGKMLDDAINAGPTAFAATHAILLKDPDYRKVIEGDNQPNAFQRRLNQMNGR